jgi:hypothetical protein
MTVIELEEYLEENPNTIYREEHDSSYSFRDESIKWYVQDSRRITNLPKEFMLQATKQDLHTAITDLQVQQSARVTAVYKSLNTPPTPPVCHGTS